MDKDHHSSTKTQQKLSPMVMTYWRIEKDYKSIKEGVQQLSSSSYWLFDFDQLIS